MPAGKTRRGISASVKQMQAGVQAQAAEPPPLSPPFLHDRDGLLRCRVCRCTDREPCNPPCGWDPEDARGDLCTACAGMLEHMLFWFDYAHRPTKAALLRELDLRIRAEFDAAQGGAP